MKQGVTGEWSVRDILAHVTTWEEEALAHLPLCAHNPLPVVVPCHRVVRSDGTIGQYVGGVEAKHRLLALESAA